MTRFSLNEAYTACPENLQLNAKKVDDKTASSFAPNLVIRPRRLVLTTYSNLIIS